jgi:predicted P-loop ATPase
MSAATDRRDIGDNDFKDKVRQFAEEARARGKAANANAKAEAPKPREEWQERLILTEKRRPAACEANAAAIISHHPALAGSVWHDEFANHPVFRRPVPWPRKDDGDERRGVPVEDADLAAMAVWMQRECGLMVSPAKVATAVSAVCRERRFHPVRDYLSMLEWDGIPRIGKWLHTYVHAEDNDYHSAVGSRWLIGGVRRVFKPGCKVDTALILEGPQGLMKSSAAAVLANEWFTDTMPDLTNKDAMQQLQGVWIVELAELSALNKSEASRIKSFMSSPSDRLRVAFGRVVQDFPRQCVFIGTVNPEGGYLKDPTGARRFWVVRCGGEDGTRKVDIGALRRDRDQLWAEAVHMHRAGHPHWLDTDDLEAAAQEQQRDRYAGDAKDALIAEWVENNAKTDKDGHRSVSVGEVLEGALHINDRSRWTQAEQNLVSKCLTAMKWMRRRIGGRNSREWRYFPLPGHDDQPDPKGGPGGGGRTKPAVEGSASQSSSVSQSSPNTGTPNAQQFQGRVPVSQCPSSFRKHEKGEQKQAAYTPPCAPQHSQENSGTHWDTGTRVILTPGCDLPGCPGQWVENEQNQQVCQCPEEGCFNTKTR